MRNKVVFAFGLILCRVCGWSQNVDVAQKLGYPQMIVYNSKIVTMDDASFEPKVGTIAQAMAIRNGKLLATGSNAEIRALAGPKTKVIDLKGRTVLPGFTSTHEHPTSWAFIEPRAFRHALPGDDVVIARWLDSKPVGEQLAQFEQVMREAVAKAKPGQWIMIVFNYGKDYQWESGILSTYRQSMKKEWLEDLAPNNPVIIKDGFLHAVVNQKAYDALHAVHPRLLPAGPITYVNPKEGPHGFITERWFEPDAMFHGKVPELAAILKAEMELWASWGFTTFGSSPYTYNIFMALDYLDKRGEMPSRFGWGYVGPDFNIDVLRYFAGMLGHGTDYLWFVGMWERIGGDCSSAPIRDEWLKTHEVGTQGLAAKGTRPCNFARGTTGREILERIIFTGNRVATLHTWGDKDIDNYMDAIEQASQRAGMTLEEIRAKRHAMDHSHNAPRLDQIPRMKKLGMIASLNHSYIWEPGGPASAAAAALRSGIEYTSWIGPRKSMTEGGIMTAFELDKSLPEKVFLFVTKGMNRYNDFDHKTYGADQKTDRTIQLKALTRWGAYYVLRENMLGSLESGKLADFVVLDKDILTIPEDQIPGIQVLMTVVGGKPAHLVPSLGSEIGMQPVGPSTWKEPIPPGW